ncbi:MAG: glycosyltransferase [Candidatus Omnitrophica bacterium]|nr:glycosyltransferase [Candidatus Omnitrophota bacterium]
MISVIINTKDRPEDLKVCVRSILKQARPVQELVIVDASRNPEEARAEMEQLLQESSIVLKYLHTKAGNAYQRNVGIANLDPDSQYVWFCDDDVVLPEYAAQTYIKKFEQHPDVAAVQGIEVNRTRQHALGNIVRRIFCVGYEGKSWKFLPSGEHVMVIHPVGDQYVGSFMVGLTCVRKRILDEFRFDEWFESYAWLEDYDFSYRIGRKYKMLITPDVKITHNRSNVSRLGPFISSRMLMLNKRYFFCKNVDKSAGRYCAFLWSLAGHLVLNCGKSIYKWDCGYFLGTLSGIGRMSLGRDC